MTAEFQEEYALTHFTVSSANDVPNRDPTVWEVQGSNDGEDFTTIFAHEGGSVWDARLQVIRFDAGDDYDDQDIGYRFFRFIAFETVQNFQLGEIEYFGDTSFPVDPKSKLTTKWASIKNTR